MIAKGYRVSFLPDENVLKVTELMFTQLPECTKDRLLEYFKGVDCVVCEVYLSDLLCV